MYKYMELYMELCTNIWNYIWNYVQIYGIILLFNTTEIKYTLFPKLIYPENI